jgi:hypothetical protein
MSQVPTIQDLTNKQTWVNYNGFSTVPVWRLQSYVFITLHLMLKRGNYSTACSARCI